ncbi:MAG: ABC transporter permease, partial [Vicinamibacterales bacterium]|nr:ABC transporter permease [Vicinamibacterales bacterium]
MLAARRRGGELRLDGAVRCFLGGTVGGADGAERRSALYTIVGRDYFRSLGLSVLRGREFTAAEAMADTPPAVAIVDETLAQALWPNSDPLGQQIRFR